jgi:hypothetical protein
MTATYPTSPAPSSPQPTRMRRSTRQSAICGGAAPGLPLHSTFRRNFSTPETTCSLLPVTAVCGVEKLEQPITDPEVAHTNPRQYEVKFVTTHVGPVPLREPAQRGESFYSGMSEVTTQPS